MSYAIVKNNSIVEILYKISPSRKILEGERILKYDPPIVDLDVYDVSYETPILDNFVFTTTLKAGGTEKLINKYIIKIDEDVDYIYGKVIGNRGPEYTQAEKEAAEYKAAGYTGTVPPYVLSWANASGMTPTQATDNIIQQALAWRAASAAIRQQRLTIKEAIRAGNVSQMASWNAFTSYMKTSLGIS